MSSDLLDALGLADRDYADTVAAGYVEADAEFAARIGGAS